MTGPVGFIGIGAMGSAIATRLVDFYELLVNDLDPALADPLVERGASFAPTDEIAERCDTVFLSLPGPKNVLSLLTGDAGLAKKLQPGTLIIDTTSSTPIVDEGLVAELEELGINYVDAPIAGGVRRAYTGDATLMVGASDDDFERARPLLETVTREVFHVGPVGAGHAAKLVNNLLNACNRFAAIETINLAEAYGIRQDLMVEVLNKSSGRSYVTEYTYPTLVAAGLQQGFTLELMRKDVRLANELAEHVGNRLQVGSLVAQLMDEAVERIGGAADQTDLMTGWASQADQGSRPTG
ncbi:MAG: NAD(P)-dependent oxidoreductase [Aeromicrobium sp.]